MTTQLNFERTNYTNSRNVLKAETINYTFEIYRNRGVIVLEIWNDYGKVNEIHFCGDTDLTDAKNKAQQMENQTNNNN